MNRMARTRSPDPRWVRDLEARFLTADLFKELGLWGEISEHELFGPASINACRCSRCRHFEGQGGDR